MSDRLVAADAAIKAGRRGEAADLIIAELSDNPGQNAAVYRALLTQLYYAGRFEEGATWSEKGAQRFPKDLQILNLRGVILRKLMRYAEALVALDAAQRLAPKDMAVLVNKGNVVLDSGDYVQAEAIFTRLVRHDPRNSEHQRMLGRALTRQGKKDQALVRFRQATALKKESVDAWLDLLGLLIETQNAPAAVEAAEKALVILPGNEKLLESKVVALRRTSQLSKAEAFLLELLPTHPKTAWLHYQLGGVISDKDRSRGNSHIRLAIALEPDKLDYKMALIESLERTRTGGDEGGFIEEAYQLAKECMKMAPPEGLNPAHLKIVYEVFVRVCDFEAMEELGGVQTLGQIWADSGRHTALLKLLAQVKTLEDRYALLEHHRIWGRNSETNAKRNPIVRPAPRAPGGKVRLGLMSSDLRRHPVGYFALPLFEHLDTDRFELYCYSFFQGQRVDDIQEFMTQKSTYRWTPEISFHDAAQMIADDQLDMLLELGGTTHMNKLDVMAYRPARLQGSWLGYPHSAGLETIDYLITDPYNTPPRRDLLVEKPLMMPKSWIGLGRMVFSEDHIIEPGLAQDRAGGVVTFGTANNPHKYNPEMFALWSRVLAEVPGSRFMFIRPEGSGASFQRNILAEFEKGGIDPSRILFEPVRGRHMPFYNKLDISLDTMPLTGGTTTTESLWMGVPVVSLIGEAFFERLSYSIMANSNTGDLATTDPDAFVRIAADLAKDRARLTHMRTNLRDWMKNGPLGQTEQYARDFYDLIEKTVRETA